MKEDQYGSWMSPKPNGQQEGDDSNQFVEELKDKRYNNLVQMDHPEVHTLPRQWKFMDNHPKNQIIGEANKMVTRSNLWNICNHLAFLSQFKTKNIDEALSNKN